MLEHSGYRHIYQMQAIGTVRSTTANAVAKSIRYQMLFCYFHVSCCNVVCEQLYVLQKERATRSPGHGPHTSHRLLWHLTQRCKH